MLPDWVFTVRSRVVVELTVNRDIRLGSICSPLVPMVLRRQRPSPSIGAPLFLARPAHSLDEHGELLLKPGMELCLVDLYSDHHSRYGSYGVFTLLDGPLAGELVEAVDHAPPIGGSWASATASWLLVDAREPVLADPARLAKLFADIVASARRAGFFWRPECSVAPNHTGADA